MAKTHFLELTTLLPALLLDACVSDPGYIPLPEADFAADHATQLCSAGPQAAAGGICESFDAFREYYRPESLELDTPTSGQAEGLSSRGLVQFIEVCQLRRLEDVVARLPLRFRQSYVFMPYSRSRQASTPDLPRAILFGSDARFVLTFGGSNELPAGTDLEMLEWNETTKTFELSFLSFPTEFWGTLAEGPETERCLEPGQTPMPTTFTRQPRQCVGCHASGTDTHALWSVYNTWIGAYGSIGDGSRDYMHSEQPEAQDYAQFISTTRQSGRYALLPLPAHPESPSAITSRPGEVPHLTIVRNATPHPEFSERPASDLATRLSTLNAKRLSERMAEQIGPYAALLTAMGDRCLNPCDGVEDLSLECQGDLGAFYRNTYRELTEFMPLALRERYVERRRHWYQELQRVGMEESERRYTLLEGLNDRVTEINPRLHFPFFANDGSVNTMQFPQSQLYALAEMRGISVENWSLEPRDGDLTYGQYMLASTSSLIESLLARMAEQIRRQRTDVSDTRNCADLAAASQAALLGEP